MFAIFSRLISVYTICHSQQSDQGLHRLPFSSIIRVYTIWNSQTDQGLHCSLFTILSSLIGVYTILHSQSDHGLQYLPFSVVWPYILTTSLVAVLWRRTLFAILSSLKKFYTICHSQQSDQSLHCHFQQSDQGLHYLLFFLSSVIIVYIIRHSQQSDQGLHYLPFSAVSSRSKSTLLFSGTVWSGSTLFAILSGLSWSTRFTIISSLIKI